MSGHHRLRILRQADAHQLPHRSAPPTNAPSRADRLTTPTCRSIAASTVDDAVAERLLDALNPNEIALALAAADEVADRHQRVSRAAELAVERARYEADRAERAFHAVEPDNRLVARSLETRWETKLAALAEAEQALASGPATRCRRCPAARNWRNSPPTCPGSGTRPPPATRTANGCCAP